MSDDALKLGELLATLRQHQVKIYRHAVDPNTNAVETVHIEFFEALAAHAAPVQHLAPALGAMAEDDSGKCACGHSMTAHDDYGQCLADGGCTVEQCGQSAVKKP